MRIISKIAAVAIAMMVYGQNGAEAKECWLLPGDACKGEKGDKGDTGPQGEQGAQGEQGVAGNDGKDGADGKDGVDGVDGKDGATGAKGDKGDTGVAGAKGDKGDTGLAGKDGKNGKDFDPEQLENGLAVSAALNVPHIDPNKKFGISLSPGFYNDQAAFGIGSAFRIDSTWQFGGSVATDFDGKNVGGKAVLTGQW